MRYIDLIFSAEVWQWPDDARLYRLCLNLGNASGNPLDRTWITIIGLHVALSICNI